MLLFDSVNVRLCSNVMKIRNLMDGCRVSRSECACYGAFLTIFDVKVENFIKLR